MFFFFNVYLAFQLTCSSANAKVPNVHVITKKVAVDTYLFIYLFFTVNDFIPYLLFESVFYCITYSYNTVVQKKTSIIVFSKYLNWLVVHFFFFTYYNSYSDPVSCNLKNVHNVILSFHSTSSYIVKSCITYTSKYFGFEPIVSVASQNRSLNRSYSM